MKALRVAGFFLMTTLFGTSVANADIIDFVDLTENGIYGESAWTSLNISGTGFDMSIAGTKNDNAAFAYLDWRNAGLGVCGDVNTSNQNLLRPGNSGNVCNPGSDDNVTTGEFLTFSFTTTVFIEKIWFNNTHDQDFTIDADDLVTINGTDFAGPGNGYAPTSNGLNNASLQASGDNFLGGFNAGPGDDLVIAFKDQQFYISGMEVRAVPAPASMMLLSLCLIVASLSLRNKKA